MKGHSSWFAQKGTRVRWVQDRRSGHGVVVKREGTYQQGILTVRDEVSGELLKLDANHVRAARMPRWKRRALYDGP